MVPDPNRSNKCADPYHSYFKMLVAEFQQKREQEHLVSANWNHITPKTRHLILKRAQEVKMYDPGETAKI